MRPTSLAGDERLLWFLLVSAAVHAAVAVSVAIGGRRVHREPVSIEVELAAPGGDGHPKAGAAGPTTPRQIAPESPSPVPKKPAATKEAPAKTFVAKAAKPVAHETTKPIARTGSISTASPVTVARTEAAGSGDALGDIRKLLETKKGGGGAGAVAGEGQGEGFGLPAGVAGRLYFRQLEAAVREVWRVPPGARRSPVEIDVRIGADGKLIAKALVTSSGEGLLDRSALAALDAADLPPPPPEFRTPLRLILRLIPPQE